MAIGVRDTQPSTFAAPGATRAITVPATCQSGDIIFVAFYAEDSGSTNPTLTAPAGEGYTAYTDAENTSPNPDFHLAAFWKRADGGDAGQSHSWSVANCGWLGGFMVLISGAIASGDPNDASAVSNTGGANLSIVCSDITPATQPHLEVCVGTHFDATAAAPPSGMSEAVDVSGTSFNYLRRTTTAAPGSRTIAITGNSNFWIGVHYLLKEAAATAKAPPIFQRPWRAWNVMR